MSYYKNKNTDWLGSRVKQGKSSEGQMVKVYACVFWCQKCLSATATYGHEWVKVDVYSFALQLANSLTYIKGRLSHCWQGGLNGLMKQDEKNEFLL